VYLPTLGKNFSLCFFYHSVISVCLHDPPVESNGKDLGEGILPLLALPPLLSPPFWKCVGFLMGRRKPVAECRCRRFFDLLRLFPGIPVVFFPRPLSFPRLCVFSREVRWSHSTRMEALSTTVSSLSNPPCLTRRFFFWSPANLKTPPRFPRLFFLSPSRSLKTDRESFSETARS